MVGMVRGPSEPLETYIEMAFAHRCHRIAADKAADNGTYVPRPNHQAQIKAARLVATIQIKYTEYAPHNVYAAAHQQKQTCGKGVGGEENE